MSVATVDRVLHGRPGVKQQTIDLITSVMNQLEYAGAPALRPRRKHLNFDVILPIGPNTFMDVLADEIEKAATIEQEADIALTISRIDGFDPDVLTAKIREVTPASDGIAVAAVENPMVREAINDASSAGVPVVTLVSDISTSRRLSYVGLDNRAAGRTAGLLLGRMVTATPGKVVLVAGSLGLNYRDHEEREMGFQRILTERFQNLTIVERLESHDDFHVTYRQIKAVLERVPDIVGIYNIGGGNRGIGAALEETGMADKVTYIGHELTQYSRQYLVNGTMDAVIDQSPQSEAKRALKILNDFHQNADIMPPHEPIPIQIYVSENLP